MGQGIGRLALTLAAGLGWSSGALAWDFVPGLPCLLTYRSDGLFVELTYDPVKPLYSISITDGSVLPRPAIFALRFEGPAGMTISTDQHRQSDGARRLTVVDRGFGNVLNGMQYNHRMVAMIGDHTIIIPLAGAAEPVARFRDCNGIPTA